MYGGWAWGQTAWGEAPDVVSGTVLGGPLGITAETDVAQPLSRSHQRPAGIASEPDAAQPLVRVHLRTLGIATETDASLALIEAKRKTVGIPLETDAPLVVVRTKRRAIGINTETDTPLALGRIEKKLLGIATETDASLAITRLSPAIIRALGLPDYSAGYGEGGWGTGIYGGGLGYSDIAMPIGIFMSPHVTTVVENDSGVHVQGVKRKTLGIALESESGLYAHRLYFRALGRALEADLAVTFPVNRSAVTVRITRASLPPVRWAYRDLVARSRRGSLSWRIPNGSLVQRALILYPPDGTYPQGRVVAVTEVDDRFAWDASQVIRNPDAYTVSNAAWQASVLAANGYVLEAVT